MDVYTPPRLEDILPKVQLTFRPLSLIAKDKKPHSDKNGIHTSGAREQKKFPAYIALLCYTRRRVPKDLPRSRHPKYIQGPRWPSDVSTLSSGSETPTNHKRLRGPITALHPTPARFHFGIMEAHSRGRTAETINPRLFWSFAASKLFWSSAAPDLSRQSSSYSINYSYSILSIETLLSELLLRTDQKHHMTCSHS